MVLKNLQVSSKSFGIVTILKTFISTIFGIIPSLYLVKVFQTSFMQIAKTRQLTIQIFIFCLIYSGTRKVFHKIMQHMLFKEVLIFDTLLINNILCFISDLKMFKSHSFALKCGTFILT